MGGASQLLDDRLELRVAEKGGEVGVLGNPVVAIAVVRGLAQEPKRLAGSTLQGGQAREIVPGVVRFGMRDAENASLYLQGLHPHRLRLSEPASGHELDADVEHRQEGIRDLRDRRRYLRCSPVRRRHSPRDPGPGRRDPREIPFLIDVTGSLAGATDNGQPG